MFPWFVLVPHTAETELYRLSPEQQQQLLKLINIMSQFIQTHFDVDKLNIASIGNVVSQMHIHIVGRSKKDPCWPGVVWGCMEFEEYDEEQLTSIQEKIVKLPGFEPLQT